MILIGSEAARYWYRDFRTSFDIDYVTTTFNQNTDKTEYHNVPLEIYRLFLKYSENKVLLPDALYTLKLSHLSWEGENKSWHKHLSDAMWFQESNCKLIPEFYSIIYDFWKHKFGGKDKIKFTKSPDEFFRDSLKREWDHDKLHDYFKVDDKPAYQNILKGYEKSVLTSEELFSKLDFRTQLLTVLEEVFVVAFERNLSFSEGFKHVVTRLSKGWWNTFALDNASILIKGFVDEKKEYTQKRIKLNKGEYNELRKSV
jgi:hypothetical protein